MRYLPLTPDDRRAMLASIGAGTVDDLFVDVPAAARRTEPFSLPPHAGEIEVERALAALAARNMPASAVPSFLGSGAYRHHVPAAVDHLIQRGEFLTAYTPYQAEIAQGTLQYLFEFQTMVAQITAMDIANASLYDGATAAAEAALMACRITRRRRVVLSGGLHGHYRETVETFGRLGAIEIVARAPDPLRTEDILADIDANTACVVVQTPTAFGHLVDLAPIAAAARAKGALLVAVVTEIVSLGLVRPPGEMGADIVAAEGQSLGNALNFGGPYLGLLATREKFVRQMPGRLCGQTVDADGRRGFVLTLSTREQHIRREKATSNICTNSGLCALAFTIHLALLGERGFARLAGINHARAVALAERLAAVPGVSVLNDTFFNEFTVKLAKPAAAVVAALAERRILAGVPANRLHPAAPGMDDLLIVAATELNTASEMDALAAGLAEVLR